MSQFIKLVEDTTSYITELFTDPKYQAMRDEDPYNFDYAYADRVQDDIDYIVETTTNPTLVCLVKLHEVAKHYCYDVKALECELAHGQMQSK